MIHKRHRKSHPNHSATHTTLSHHITSPRKGHPCRPPHPTHISPKLFPCLPPFVSTFSSRLELSFRQRRVHQQPEVPNLSPGFTSARSPGPVVCEGDRSHRNGFHFPLPSWRGEQVRHDRYTSPRLSIVRHGEPPLAPLRDGEEAKLSEIDEARVGYSRHACNVAGNIETPFRCACLPVCAFRFVPCLELESARRLLLSSTS